MPFDPRFPVNLDIVTVHNFDAVLAKKYFVVCVPTVYGKLFPRLICCPDHHYFDPLHIDGCVHEFNPPLPPPPPPAKPDYLPPPIFGSPQPFITHAGAPLTNGGFLSVKKRELTNEDLIIKSKENTQ